MKFVTDGSVSRPNSSNRARVLGPDPVVLAGAFLEGDVLHRGDPCGDGGGVHRRRPGVNDIGHLRREVSPAEPKPAMP